VFTRQKTKTTKKKNQIPITVYLSKEALVILKKWGNEDMTPDNYVFPIYTDENSVQKNIRNAEQQLKMINKHMRVIAAELKIKQDFTFYAARHSFATTLKRQGRSIEEIQEFIGHSDKKTTERYLASFGDEHKRSVMNDFVKKLKTA
jgi:integrase